jgi:predicted ester cyclase
VPNAEHVHPLLFGECRCTPDEAANVDLILRYRSAPTVERGRFFAPGYRRHRPGLVHLGEISGAAEGDRSGMITDDALPDRHDEIIDIVASGDRVTAMWRVQGTHDGPLEGVAATHRGVDVEEVGMWRIVDGLITDSWFLADEAALVRQIGLPLHHGE